MDGSASVGQGQQPITATFYPSLAGLVPGLDVDDPEVRGRIQALTSTPAGTDPALADAAR